TQGFVERFFKAHVRIDFERAVRRDTGTGRPLAEVKAAVVSQVQTALESRVAAGGCDQPLRHGAAGCGPELEAEVAKFSFYDLGRGGLANKQGAGDQHEIASMSHASLLG